MVTENFSVIILAAGQGTRMRTPLPKVLHPVAGEPMISRVVKACQKAKVREIRVVVGFGEDLVRQVVEPLGAVCHRQSQQLGTADAVRAAQPETLEGTVLILNGDHPLLSADDISGFIETFKGHDWSLGLVSCRLKNPGNYGRVIRSNGALYSIVEAKDASQEALKINEVNTGIYLVDSKALNTHLPKVGNKNAQKEFYLTDLIELCRAAGERIGVLEAKAHVARGVNSQLELAQATTWIFHRKVKALLESGVIVIDPRTTYIEDDVTIGEGSVIYPGVYIKGPSSIDRFCVIESHSFITRAEIAESVEIKAGSYIEDTLIKARAVVGPYARLRPGTEIGEEARVGNFVEMKKVIFGDRAKANHLSYLGDAFVGEDTNIGCGTITCNYATDRKKYVTRIGKNVFVGSDSQFVAPIEIGDNAIIGSGSTITHSVPDGALAVARGRQIVRENYKPRESSPSSPQEKAETQKPSK